MSKPPKKTAKKYTKNNKYWGIWSQCKRKLSDYMTDSEIEEERQEILRLAGAKPDAKGHYSMTRLTNDQFSTALDLMETTILGKTNKKRRTRTKIYAIEQLGISDDDLNDVAFDTWRNDDWRTLTHDQLCKLQMTAKRIAAQRKKKAKSQPSS